jgi:hypothetical protein
MSCSPELRRPRTGVAGWATRNPAATDRYASTLAGQSIPLPAQFAS